MVSTPAPTTLGALWRSDALRTAAVYAGAGGAFAVANLLLARVMSYREYALFALVVAFLNLGIPFAPAGADGIVNRRPVPAGPRLLRRALLTSAAVAAVAVLVGFAVYGLAPEVLALIAVAMIAGGANHVAGAYFQSVRRFGVSLTLYQAMNFVILGVAVYAAVTGAVGARSAVALVAAGYVVIAVVGWRRLVRDHGRPAVDDEPFPWGEALSFVGVSGVTVLLGQLERFLVPKLLGLEALATFGVLAATVGSVFRVLLLSVGYSMFPRLRAAPDLAARRRLVTREAAAVGGFVAVACVAIWVLAPVVVRLVLAGKYALPGALMAASIATGLVKVASAFARAVVSALGDARQLARLNVLGWLSVAVAVTGAAVGARWGLTGLVYGMGFGWLAQALSAAHLALPYLRDETPDAEPAAVPR